MLKEDDTVVWITVNGVHIPIKSGEDKDTQVKAFLDRKAKQDASKAKWKAEPKPKNNVEPKGVSYGDGVYDIDKQDDPIPYNDPSRVDQRLRDNPDFQNLQRTINDDKRYDDTSTIKKRIDDLSGVYFKDPDIRKKVLGMLKF